MGGPSGYCIKFNSHVNKLDLSNIDGKTQSKILENLMKRKKANGLVGLQGMS